MKTATIRMKTDEIAEVLIYDTIGGSGGWFDDPGISAKSFREQIKGLKAKTINLRINSPGGSTVDAAAMLAALDEHPGRVEVDIDGLAASAASVIAMAGDVVRISADGLLMIHNPHAMALGGADEMRRTADLLDKVRGQMLDRYALKTGAKADREQVGAWMDAETWFTGKEAVDAGLADETSGAMRMAACADLSKFKYRHPPVIAGPTPEQWAETQRRKDALARLQAGAG